MKEAAILVMREILRQIKDDKPIPSEVLNTLQIKMEHFLTILDRIKPS